jgi:hypothetical protein
VFTPVPLRCEEASLGHMLARAIAMENTPHLYNRGSTNVAVMNRRLRLDNVFCTSHNPSKETRNKTLIMRQLMRDVFSQSLMVQANLIVQF